LGDVRRRAVIGGEADVKGSDIVGVFWVRSSSATDKAVGPG